MAFGVKLRVWGDLAAFNRPEMKVERVSYDVITPSAARGILEAIYWKPQMRWVVDRLHVLAPIRVTQVRRNEIGATISATLAARAMNKARASSDSRSTNSGSSEPRRCCVMSNTAWRRMSRWSTTLTPRETVWRSLKRSTWIASSGGLPRGSVFIGPTSVAASSLRTSSSWRSFRLVRTSWPGTGTSASCCTTSSSFPTLKERLSSPPEVSE